jgi:outer membrane protein insertion porin family
VRREIWLNEQDVMNMELLKLSIRRVNQLGYFRPIEGPEIQPVAGEENKLDIILPAQEQNRNQFTFGGGVSGLEGAFINLSFSTTNFLGRGETASFMIQTGSRTQNFQIAITEPWFLDRPITAGFDIFKRTLRLPQFTRRDTGLNLVFGVPVKRFSRMFLNYGYAVIKTSDPEGIFLDPANPFVGVDPRFTSALFGFGIGDFTQSKITPTFVHNTVDNPLFAFKGKRYTASLEFSGGPLGGTLDFYKPSLEGIWYLPVSRRTNFGFRTMVSWIEPFGGTPVPFFERFFLGGENQIRGYDIRTVGPRITNEAGVSQLVGGIKMMLFNVEYYIPLAGPLRAVLFFDAGQTFAEGEPWRFSMFNALSTSTGAEMRFFVPVLNVPFRLIFAYNPNREPFQPATAFRFGIGSTF